MIIKKYRKKPVIIEAYISEEELIIHTLEGDMKANKGDYIITGINGEKYPCKPDIFIKTYEEVWIYLLFVFVLIFELSVANCSSKTEIFSNNSL